MLDERYVLGVDIGGTNVRMGLVDQLYQMSGFERVPTLSVFTDNDAPARLSDAILSYIERNGVKNHVAAVSIGVPSVVKKDHSFVYNTPNVPGLNEIDLGIRVENMIGLPVFVDRDVNFLLVNDIHKYNLDPDNNRTIIGCYLGTGFGNALYINGRIHLGSHGVAGELGHIPLYGVDELCTCGLPGCSETRVSGRHLRRLTEQHFPDTFIGDVFTKHRDDPEIVKFVEDTAAVIATEVTLLDPDCIILGSGVFAMKDFPMERLMDEVRRRARHPLPSEDLHFMTVEDSQSAGVFGGALTVMSYLMMGQPFRS